MVGIVVVAHGRLAAEMVQALQLIVSRQFDALSPKVLTSGRSRGPRASVRTGVRLHIVPTTGSSRL